MLLSPPYTNDKKKRLRELLNFFKLFFCGILKTKFVTVLLGCFPIRFTVHSLGDSDRFSIHKRWWSVLMHL